MRKNIHRLPVLLLAAAFLIISVINLALPDRQLSENENRYLQQLPKASLDSVINGDFEESFQDYINDQLMLREALMKLKARLAVITGAREINGVYIGDDGRFLEAVKPWDIDESRLAGNIAAVESFFESCGIEKENRSVMIVPTASFICAQSLPPFAPAADQKKILDEIRKGVPSARVVDVSDTLMQVDYRQFYFTDHHWTSDAAYDSYKLWRAGRESFDGYERTVAAEDFRGTLYSKTLFGSQRDSIEIYSGGREFTAVCDGEKKPLFDMSALEKKDKYAVFIGGNYSEVTIDAAGEGRLLIIKDSFANCFTQFAVNDYERVHLLDLRYFNGDVSRYISENGITEILLLYGLNTFISDRNVLKLDLYAAYN